MSESSESLSASGLVRKLYYHFLLLTDQQGMRPLVEYFSWTIVWQFKSDRLPSCPVTSSADYNKGPLVATGVIAGLTMLVEGLQTDLKSLCFRLFGFRIANNFDVDLVANGMFVESAVEIVPGANLLVIDFDDQIKQRCT